jgi:colanic acid/amylovoran biosynthesis glycosyltransferase
MLTVAYLANLFPSSAEPYVGDEVRELQRRGIRIVTGSVRKAPSRYRNSADDQSPNIVLQPWRVGLLLRALCLCLWRWKEISPLLARILLRGKEGPWRRAKALVHTWLGACYAQRLREYAIDHIHVHHGYFGSWIALTAARLLKVGFSMTLHGSDLLLHGSYLDAKLEYCKLCLTVSEFNRQYILHHYPGVAAQKVVVSRLGVEIPDGLAEPRTRQENDRPFALLAVGRLHRVKDHAFLVRACAQLRVHGLHFECAIAGDGPERRSLEELIWKEGLEKRVSLLGQVPREQMGSLYSRADLVVLTSRSEGLPLVLMEAMARGKIVLAPAITGIPELVVDTKNGFLFQPGSQGDFVARVLFIHSLFQRDRVHGSVVPSASRRLDWIRHAAQVTVRHHFNGRKNLEAFAELFIDAVNLKGTIHANSLLQQIQFSVQRHRSVPVRIDGADALSGPRSSAVLDG